MKLPNNVNPAHCASKDACRYVLNGVKISDGIAVATNGRVLVGTIATREDDDADRPALVPTRAMLKAFPKRGGKGKRRRGALLPRLVIDAIPEADPVAKLGTVTVIDKEFDRTTVKEIDGTFPAFEQVFTDHTKATLKVGLNATYLAMIAKSLGDDQLVLHIDPEGFDQRESVKSYQPAIYVTGSNDHDRESVAILMPVRVSIDGLSNNCVLNEVWKIKAAKSAEAAVREAAAAESQLQTTNPQ